jgi:pyrroloquinoline quinone biosynthesis protein D
MDRTWCPRPSTSARVRRETDELTLITHGNDIFVTNRTGAAIWELLDGRTSVAEVAHRLTERYRIDAETAGAQSQRFIGELLARGIVE